MLVTAWPAVGAAKEGEWPGAEILARDEELLVMPRSRKVGGRCGSVRTKNTHRTYIRLGKLLEYCCRSVSNCKALFRSFRSMLCTDG